MIKAFLDTSTTQASFALVKGEETIAFLNKECQRGASRLLPEIIKVIADCGLGVADVEEWYVGKGPGSFTGLRVGISFVQGICMGSGAKFQGVNSGYAYFQKWLSLEPGIEEITVLHDGRKREVICNSFKKMSDGCWSESGIEVLAVDDLERSDFRNFVTVMKEEDLPDGLNVLFMTELYPVNFLKSPISVNFNAEEMSKSCEPIYVRPPVFVKPAVALKK